MKATLEFDLECPYEREAMDDALKGSAYKYIIDDIWEKVFRPNRKHGYDAEIEALIEQAPEVCSDLIEKLAAIYLEIKEDL